MWGTASIKDLCRHAKHHGYKSIALTDIDNLCGMWKFIKECKRQGLKPIIGAQVTDPNFLSHRAVCLVKNSPGYSNLTRLITCRHRDKNFSIKTFMPKFAKGLVVLTNNHDLLSFWHERNVDLAVDVVRHPLSQQHPLCVIAKKLDIPLIATPDSFFLNREDMKNHRILRAIEKDSCLSRLSCKDTAPESAFFGSFEMYKKKFHTSPQVLNNSHVLAEKLEFQDPSFGTVMPPWKENRGLRADKLLYKRTMQGAKNRYGLCLSDTVIRRIDYELSIIRQKNFCEYFLVVERIVKKASRICGRGSAASSIVAYCLGITNVCPIKYNLYFERFLNPDREDPPDIDIDFAWDERDDILNWVLQEFKDHAAMVSSHILFQPKMAVREVARVFGLPEREISQMSKRLPWFWKLDKVSSDLPGGIRNFSEFKSIGFADPWPQIMEYAKAIIGIPRYMSVHPGGIVITPAPINTYVPVETAPKGIPIIQWEKDSAEEAGLVKIDLLGNRSLGVIRDCIASVKQSVGEFDSFKNFDPEDDYETKQNVAQGNTMGCFYIESPAMRLLQKKTRVGDFEHVVIHSSIIRPAANEFIQKYIQRLHTGIWKPIHPLLKDVLSETYGIMVYQEDVSRVAVKMAGFTHAQGDGLRKIISKKEKTLKLQNYYSRFKNGALKKGVSLKDIKLVWNMITSFSGYSFCKPHSASYARVSFQAAYLKTHYPAEFMAAVISNQGGFYSVFAYVSEARRLNVKILHPDINRSDIHWKGYRFELIVGLQAIRDLSLQTMQTIIKERGEKQFLTLVDFFDRVNPKENEIRSLVHSGSLDSLDKNNNRAVILWIFEIWKNQNKTKRTGHLSEFNNFEHNHKYPEKLLHNILISEIPVFDTSISDTLIPDLPSDDYFEKLRREFVVLGFLCNGHPIVLYKNIIKTHNGVKAKYLPEFVNKTVVFAGWLITGKVVKTKQGQPMKFLTFEDETGIVETVFFPKPYALFCHMLDYGKPYLLYGRVDLNWGAITLIVDKTRAIQKKL